MARKHNNNGTGMSNRKIKPRIPPQVQLPSLGETLTQAPAVEQPQVQPQAQPQQPQQVQEAPAPQPQEPQAPAPIQETQEFDVPDIAEAKPYDETYHKLKTEKHGELEFDLVSHRQRGVEKRYLNVRIKGMRMDKKEEGAVECLMNVTSKEDFQNLKDFFANLNWDD
ncbi:MAG: hypothetical protein P8J32_02690 [bacterium]|nr:hypothetical protein [bacterium]